MCRSPHGWATWELWPFGDCYAPSTGVRHARPNSVADSRVLVQSVLRQILWHSPLLANFLSIVYRGLSVAFHGKKHLKTWPSPGKVDLIVPDSYQSRLQETSKFWESEPTSLKQIHPPIGFATKWWLFDDLSRIAVMRVLWQQSLFQILYNDNLKTHKKIEGRT